MLSLMLLRVGLQIKLQDNHLPPNRSGMGGLLLGMSG
jgi:hypothetical protein